jgi:hypothetical protein
VVAAVIGAINIQKLVLLFTGRLSEDQLVQVVEAEGLKEAEEQLREVKV